MKLKFKITIVLVIVFSVFTVKAQENSYWTKINQTSFVGKNLNQKQYTTFQLDFEALKTKLQLAPKRFISTVSNTQIELPNSKGQLHTFKVYEAPVLSEALTLQYPNIKTYVAYCVDVPGVRARLSITPQGLQAMINYTDNATNFIAPLSKGDNTNYIIYNRDVRLNTLRNFDCLTQNEASFNINETQSRLANDQTLKTFRIAISTTAEYTNFWDDDDDNNGNAQADALAQVVNTLNRVNEVFEVDMAINFTLVTGTELIYTDIVTDPYSDMLNTQLQSTLTSTVGETNYDIGHLFTYGATTGNANCIGCVCVDGQKGSGYSSHTFLDNDGGPYMSDFFDIDVVSHEIGHQMGANHTFSMFDEFEGANVEPGSGSTIMGYAGITGVNDIQGHADPYFHYFSITQIETNLQNRTCWQGTAITNNAPIANAGSDYTIPSGTAFVLKGTATDTDASDVLTHTWEQIDNGVTIANNFGPNKTSGAVWRSRPPSLSSDRFMPTIERVISGQLTETNPTITVDNSSWETVSSVSRTLNFALTVRDRAAENGTGLSPQSDYDTMTVTVDGSSGPFSVTSQSTNELWDIGSNQTITWDVAGTNTGTVNTPTVNILMSTDGGYTFPFVLASNVPNDGEHDIVVPVTGGGDSSTVRIKVEGHNNIFYAINSTNFSLQESEFVLTLSNAIVDVCVPNDAQFNFTYNTYLGFTDETQFSTSGLPASVSTIFSPSSASVNNTEVSLSVSGTQNLSPGNYPFTIIGTSGTVSKSVNAQLHVFDTNFNNITIISPLNAATDVAISPAIFTWIADVNATAYEFEVATDTNFSNIIETATVTNMSYETSNLEVSTQYFWRVRAINNCGNGNYTQASFTTTNIACNSTNATNTPIAISTSGNVTYTSIINIPYDFPVTDVNVGLTILHTWASDLDVSLRSPSGTIVELTSDNGGNADNYINTIFDNDASTPIVSGSAPFTGSFIPEGDLSLFNGESSLGDWTLFVVDDESGDGGSIETFTLELCVLQSLSVTDNQLNDSLKLYPNPNNGTFNIVLSTGVSDKISLTMFDINGRLIYEKHMQSSGVLNHKLSLENLQSGLYLLKIKNGNAETIRKVIID
jgi:subtilisin-like proprotein convertase family protein